MFLFAPLRLSSQKLYFGRKTLEGRTFACPFTRTHARTRPRNYAYDGNEWGKSNGRSIKNVTICCMCCDTQQWQVSEVVFLT